MNQSTATTDGNRPGDALKAWCVLMVLSGCALLFALKTQDCFVDDAFIGFQYIDNLTAGNGFVFHSGDRPVEGVTNIGWLLAVAAFSGLAPPATVAKLLGLGLAILVLALLVAVGRMFALKDPNHPSSFALATVPAVLLMGSFDFIYFSTAGMETALLAAMLTACCCIALFRTASLWPPALIAAASLVHPEAAIVFPIYLLLRSLLKKGATAGLSSSASGISRKNTAGQASSGTRIFKNRLFQRAVSHYRQNDRRRLIGGVLLWAAILAAITAVRWSYFGDIVPNTFHSKPSSPQLVIQNVYNFLMGVNTNVPFPIVGLMSLPLLLLGYFRLRRASASGADMTAAVAATGLLFAVYSPTDWTATARCFAPYLPAALLLLWSGVAEACELLMPTRHRTRQFVAAAVVFVLALATIHNCLSKLSRLDDFPGYVMAGRNLVGPAAWMRENLPSESVIATRRIGAVAYFSHHPVFDYAYGLPDAETARLVAQNGGRFDNPAAPALAEQWEKHHPDYLLEDAPMIHYIVSQTGGTPENFTIHGEKYGVIRRFPIGRGVQWVLAGRLKK